MPDEMKVSDLKLNPGNPRQIRGEKLELLKKSVSEFREMMELRPIIVDENNVVLGGNMRLQAIKALGIKEIPPEWVKRADLTEEQKREFVIKDNAGFGEWDWDLLANDWSDLPLADWGVDGIPEDSAPSEIQKMELVGFEQAHILLSFPPDMFIELQPLIQQIAAMPGIEYEQSAN